MNITKNSAGAVSDEHIKSKGFEVFDIREGNDMGQCSWSMPQYKNSKCKITGGYWHWTITNNEGKKLWEGWWNTNEEFNETITNLKLI